MKVICAPLSLLVASMLTLSADETREPLNFDLNLDPIASIEGQAPVSYADILDKATPSVVAVYTAKIVNISNARRRQNVPEIFRQFGLAPPEATPSPGQRGGGGRERRQQVGMGSGVIVSENGYVVTNHHVIVDEYGGRVDEILVRLGDGTEHVADLIGSDQKTDIAVLKIDSDEQFPAVTVADSNKLRVGDIVFAIGNPLEVGLTATQGIVSATGRNSLGILGNEGYENFIQTDASINLGNSGGALIDAEGRLVGINTAIVSGAGGSIGIGFAIPMNLIRNVITNLIESGEVPRGLLGLRPENLTQELAEAFGLESTKGALVNQVMEDSPAERGGILHGDIIVRVDDVMIESAPQLRLTVSQMQPGSEVEVELIRQGEKVILSVVLGSLTGKVAAAAPEQGVLEGVRLSELSGAVREELQLPNGLYGVLISEVYEDSPYVDKIVPSMVILEVNGRPTEFPEDVERSLVQGVNRLYVWIGGRNLFVALNIVE